MKKKVLIISLIIIIPIIAYISYKAYYLYEYRINSEVIENYDNLINGLNFKETITQNTKDLEEKEYLKFQKIKIKNEFNDFVIDSKGTEYVKYNLYTETNSLSPKASLAIGTETTYMSRLNSEEMQEFYQKHNIKNDLDILKYLSENKTPKRTLLTSINEIKCEYLLREYMALNLPNASNIIEITGDNIGYILIGKNNTTEVVILKDDKRYILSFTNQNYFTEDYIKNTLINNIKIN